MIDTLNDNLQTIYNELMTKLIPENLRSGVNLLNVTGTLEEGGVKLFKTIEEMRADTTAKEGDLAIVYRNEVQNATVDSRFQTATFPDTVVLDTAITDYIEVRYRAVDSSKMFDCWGSLDSSRFMMDCHTDNGSVRIEYESSDGITYTRTDTTGNPVDFGTEIYYEIPEMWNDAIGKFIQIGGGTFEGLYQSQSIKVKNTYILDNNRIKIAQYDNFNDSQYALIIKHKFSENEISEYTLLTMNKNIYPFIDSNNKLWVYNSNLTTSLEEYSVNAESYSSRSIIAETSISSGAIVKNITDIGITVDLDSCIPLGNPLYSGDSTDVVKTIDELTKIKDISTIEPEQVYELKYLPASTQLNATPDYVYEKKFYGKNGAGTGTLTQDISNSFNDTNAEVYNTIQNQYESMEPRILTDSDKTIDISIYCIPVKRDGTPLLDTSNVTDMSGMFSRCTSLTTIPLLDTSNVTNMDSMFSDCTNLTTIPLLDTSNVTNMYSMFSDCTNLTTIPLLDTSNVTNMNHMFDGCTSLTTIPLLDTSNVTNTSYMFSRCTSLTTIPLLDTSNVTNMYSMFSDCTNLTTIPLLDTSNVTNMNHMFDGCTSLSDESLNNILVICKNAVKITSNKTLKYIGLTKKQANICQSLSNYQDFINAGWTTGY